MYLNSSTNLASTEATSTIFFTHHKPPPPSSSSSSNPILNSTYNDFIPSRDFQEIENIAKYKLSSLYSSFGWSMTPITFFLISLIPITVYIYTSFSLFYLISSIMITLIYCIYCNNIKLRRERATMVLGVVSDPNILELVTKSMPGWVLSNERGRVDWVNQLLLESWPMLSRFAEYKISTKAKEIFEKEKPDLLTSMMMKEVVGGSVPPKIISIHVLNTRLDESEVNSQVFLEVEFSWNSNGYVSVEIGFLGQTFSIKICELKFLGTVKVAIVPSPPETPYKPMKAMRVTFMKAPQVDITVSFGDLLPNSSINAKVMGLGPIISEVIN